MNISQMLINTYKKLISKIKLSRERGRWHNGIKKTYRHINPNRKLISLNIEAHKKKWEKLYPKVNPIWYKTYSYLSGKENINYVPEDIFHMLISSKLNRHDMVPAYKDKNMYDRNNPNIPDVFPDTFLRNIDGVFYDKDYCKIDNIKTYLAKINKENIVVKPSIETGSGKNVRFFSKKNGQYLSKKGEQLSLNFLKNHYNKNYLIQTRIKQHKYFAAFNESSLNSIRITAYRSVKTEEVMILHGNIRMGGKNSQVDNVSGGGVAVCVFPNGKIQEYASDLYGKRIYSPPSRPELKFSEFDKVPYWDDICETAKKIAENYHYCRILGYDFCLQEDGKVRLVEINISGLGIALQYDSGSLFGDYTDEVIEYCLNSN